MDTFLSLSVIIISLFVGIMQFFYSSKPWKITFCVLLFFITIISIYLYHSTEEQTDQLKIKTSGLQNTLDYSFVATLDTIGDISPKNTGFIKSTNLNSILNPLISSGEIIVQCTDQLSASTTLTILNKAIQYDPKFPFSYFFRGECEKMFNLNNWEPDMKTAQNILEITTTISGHNEDHDAVLCYLKNYFSINKICNSY